MKGLEKLKYMAKNGEVSKKLLEDEEFKNELKKALKENGVEVTDDQINEIIKNFENSLQNEENLKEVEKELENVSGGSLASKAVKGTSMIAGALIGNCIGTYAGVGVGSISYGWDLAQKMKGKSKEEQQQIMKDAKKDPNSLAKVLIPTGRGSGLGIAGGIYLGNKLGKYICNKLGIKE